MPPYSDAYLLVSDRSATAIARFLDHFVPNREEVADGYEVPQYADAPDHHFRRVEELIAYLEGHALEDYGIYWRNTGEGPAFAMAFFTSDGAVILGLACIEDEATAWLTELRAFAGSGPCCILFEQPPPDSAAAFRALAAVRS